MCILFIYKKIYFYYAQEKKKKKEAVKAIVNSLPNTDKKIRSSRKRSLVFVGFGVKLSSQVVHQMQGYFDENECLLSV
jgi:hypothetical protein